MLLIRVTKNQSIIGKKKMGHHPTYTTYPSSREALNEASFHSLLQNTRERLHCQNEKKMGKGISLSQTSKTCKETNRSSINQNRKTRKGNAPPNPLNPKAQFFPWMLIRTPSSHGHKSFQCPFCRWPPFLSSLALHLKSHLLWRLHPRFSYLPQKHVRSLKLLSNCKSLL